MQLTPQKLHLTLLLQQLHLNRAGGKTVRFSYGI